MAAPTILEGYKAAAYYDSNGSGSYVAIGAVNSEALARIAAVAEAKVRDNSSIFTKPTMTRRMTSEDATLTLEGYYDKTFYDALNALFAAGTARNWRFDILGGNRVQASFLMTALDLNGNALDDSFISMTMTLVLASGAVTVGDQS